MEKAALNQKVIQYQRTRKEELFLDVYQQIRAQIDPYLQVTAKQLDTEVNEILSLAHETMIRTLNQYTGQHDYEHYFNRSYKNAKRDYLRKKQTKERYEYLSRELLREERQSYNDPDYHNEMQQNIGTLRSEQQKILNDLLAKTEDLTTIAIVQAFPQYTSITAVGKALGLHHETVKRKLRRLALLYDEGKFGQIQDYLS